MAKVEIYYAQMCGLCHKAMDYFREKGIPFDAYEVKWKGDGWEDSENAREMRRRCGDDVDFVPQIFINGRHIKGWKTLSVLIESGEIDRELEREGYPFSERRTAFTPKRGPQATIRGTGAAANNGRADAVGHRTP